MRNVVVFNVLLLADIAPWSVREEDPVGLPMLRASCYSTISKSSTRLPWDRVAPDTPVPARLPRAFFVGAPVGELWLTLPVL